MSLRPLFKGARDDFNMEYCAHCGAYMTVRNIITVGGKKVKVCSVKCEKAMKAAHEVARGEKIAERL